MSCDFQQLHNTIILRSEATWPSDRQRIREWLTQNSEQLADLYAGAVELLQMSSLPGKLRFVCHAVREIRNRLPDVIAGSNAGGRLDYTARVNTLSELFERNGFLEESGSLYVVSDDAVNPSAATVQYVRLTEEVYLSVRELITDHRRASSSVRARAQQLFDAGHPYSGLHSQQIQPVVSTWMDTTQWFMVRAHESLRESNDEGDLESKFEQFEQCLLPFAHSFFENMEDVDAILAEANQ